MRFKTNVVLVVLLSIGILAAQEFRANISGHITDSTGAVVPLAKVQATNLATKETSSAISDNSGSYTIPLLQPGMYKLTVQATGFKQYVLSSISLEISQTAGIDARLEVGDVNQTVEVTGEAALLDTQSGNRSGLIDTTEVAELPLNSGRNPFMLGLTASGVTYRGASIWQRPFDNGAIADWVVNGGWQSSNEFLLDGAANNAQMGTNNIAYVPIQDTVQEFTMMQNTYDAQFGHTMGGILNTVMKSGGSAFHGDAWEFMRRSALDANNFQNNSASIYAPRPNHYLDDYGGLVSGQVIVPKILKRDGYIKLFYMGAFQNYREATADPLNTLSWPTPEMRTGDFSKLVNGAGLPITIYDPMTAVYDASGNVVTNRQPFPGNIIPSNRINPAAQVLTKLMPMPNTSTPGYRYGTGDYSLPDVTDHDAYYNMTIKFDWTVGDKNRFFMREGSNDRTEHRPVNGIVGMGEDGQLPFQRINDSYVLDWTSTLSPSTVVDVRASNSRFIEKGSGFADAGFDLTTLGIPKSLIGQLPGGYLMGVWSIGGYQTLGRTSSDNITNSYGLEGSITRVAGKHTLKIGVDTRRIQYLVLDTGSILEEDFNSAFTQQIYNNAGNGLGGDGYASFLLGYPSGGQSNYAAYPFYRQWYIAPFLQDDWKVSSRLTLNLGLRYDINEPITEKYNRLDYAFNPNVANPIGPMAVANIAALKLNIPAQYASLYNNLANLKGGMQFAGVNGNSPMPANIDWTGIQPRIGFAYRLKDRLVMRGGYAMFVINPNNDWMQTAGFSSNTSLVSSTDGSGRIPIQGVMNNPFPAGINPPPGSSLGVLTYAGKNINWFNPNYKLPRSNQFSFGFQYQLTQGGTLDVSYVGNRAAHTQSNIGFDINPNYEQCGVLYGAKVPAGLNFASPAAYCNQTLPNPFQGLAPFLGTSMYTSSTISLNQLMRQYPQFTGGTEYGLNDGHVWYNSLQLNYNHRMRNGLNFLFNYTLSKQNERWGYLNIYQQPIQYQEGLYYADRPHFLKLSMVYDLPFGKGKHFLTGVHGVADRLVSGWQFNTFITDSPLGEPANQSGSIEALKNPGLSTVHWGANKVQIYNNCILNEDDTGAIAPLPSSLANGCSATDWSQYAWLQLPPNYRPNQVNSSRSPNVRVQGSYTADASLIKDTRITERVKGQFRFEAFNAFNHWNYMLANVNNSATDPNFGSIIPHTQSTQASVNPRSIQLGFKVIW